MSWKPIEPFFTKPRVEIKELSSDEMHERSIHDMLSMGVISEKEASEALAKLKKPKTAIVIGHGGGAKTHGGGSKTDFDEIYIEKARGRELDKIGSMMGIERFDDGTGSKETYETDSMLRSRIKERMGMKTFVPIDDAELDSIAGSMVGLNWIAVKVGDAFKSDDGRTWTMTINGPVVLSEFVEDSITDALRYSVGEEPKTFTSTQNFKDLLEKI